MKTLILAAALALVVPNFARAQESDSIRDSLRGPNSQQSDTTAQDADTGMSPTNPNNMGNQSTTDTTLTPPTDQVRDQQPPSTQAPSAQAAPVAQAPSPAVVSEAKPTLGGDLRAPSPKIFDVNRRGYFQAAVGPAYGIGFVSDSLMYNVQGSYNFNIDNRITVKGLADLYSASGSVTSRMFDFGVGADIFLPEAMPSSGILPYASADLTLANARNAEDKTATGLGIGGGAGFKFQAAELNWDITAHYALLTEQISDRNPSILSLRAAVNF